MTTVTKALEKWFTKSLSKLPQEVRSVASAYVKKWDELSPSERRLRAIEVDRQRETKTEIKFDQAVRARKQNEADPKLRDEELIGHYDRTMKATMWLKRVSASPDEASMLLCRIEPLSRRDPELVYVDDDKTSPDRYRLLRRVFLDVAEADPKPRTLLDWREVAKREGLPYHEWIDEYVQARGDAADSTGEGGAAKIDAGATAKETPVERQARLQKCANEKKHAGVKAWKKKTADEEGISTSMLDKILRRISKSDEGKPGTIEGLKRIGK